MTVNRSTPPNDVAVHTDGHIWFTDPGYGIMLNYEGHIAEPELPTCVYRLNPDTGEATSATGELEKPNGICFSPDYNKVYIVDTGVYAYRGNPAVYLCLRCNRRRKTRKARGVLRHGSRYC